MGRVLAGFLQTSRGPESGVPHLIMGRLLQEEGAVFICAPALDFEKDPIVCKAGGSFRVQGSRNKWERIVCVFFRLIRGPLSD